MQQTMMKCTEHSNWRYIIISTKTVVSKKQTCWWLGQKVGHFWCMLDFHEIWLNYGGVFHITSKAMLGRHGSMIDRKHFTKALLTPKLKHAKLQTRVVEYYVMRQKHYLIQLTLHKFVAKTKRFFSDILYIKKFPQNMHIHVFKLPVKQST